MTSVPHDRRAEDGPIHAWFGLTYANYLVLPRTILQSMPEDWQQKLIDLVDEANDTFDLPLRFYTVNCRDRSGRFISDPIPHYDRGRTRLLQEEATS